MWMWVTAIIIIVLLCSSCRGGRSLGKGSVGTVIVPQTPKQINERNRQPPPKIVLPQLELLPPVPIVPPKSTRVVRNAVRSTPTLPETNPVKANPVIINPKPAGELKPFSPSVSSTSPVIITAQEKNQPTDNKATDGEIVLDPRESEGFPEERPFIKWGELISYWLFVILMAVFGWIIYDTVMGFIKEKKLQKKENDTAKKAQKKLIKKPAKASRKSRKKAISKKGKK